MSAELGTPTPPGAHKPGSFKEKATEELRSFLILFFYLWLLFGVFVVNQGIVLREEGINFTMQGFAFINALVFAKVMMVFELFDPGRWLRKRPLIYPILYETLLLTVLFLVVHVLEKVIEGLFHGKTAMGERPGDGRRRTSWTSQRVRHYVSGASALLRNSEPESVNGQRTARCDVVR